MKCHTGFVFFDGRRYRICKATPNGESNDNYCVILRPSFTCRCLLCAFLSEHLSRGTFLVSELNQGQLTISNAIQLFSFTLVHPVPISLFPL